MTPASGTERARGPTRRPYAVAALVLVLLASTLLAGCTMPTPDEAEDPPAPREDLYFAVEDGEGVLAPEDGTSEQDSVGTDPAAGAAALATEMAHNYAGTDRGDPAGVLAFRTAPLDRTYHLDVSQHVRGTLYWQTTTSAATHTTDVHLRVVLEADGEFVGATWPEMDGGAITTTGYYEHPYQMMSETDTFEEGTRLALRVEVYGTLSSFEVGLSGETQSNVSFAHHPDWSRKAYVDSYTGELTFIDNQTTAAEAGLPGYDRPVHVHDDGTPHHHHGDETNDGTPPADARAADAGPAATPAASQGMLIGLAAGAGLAGIAVLAVSRRRRPPGGGLLGVLVVALLVLPALSGCIGGVPGAGQEGSAGEIDPASDDRRDRLEARGAGDVEGVVYDEIGVPVEEAHVTVLGTDNFTKTDQKGRFAFRSIPAGSYTLRVDAEGYESRETGFEVRVGNVTRVEVVVTVSASGAGFKSHRHDMWDGQQQITIFDGQIEPEENPTYGLPNSLCSYTYSTCSVPFRPGEGKLVLPGTDRIEVTVSWSDPQVDQAGVGIVPADRTDAYTFAEKPSGSSWTIPVDPTMTDRGHQSFSLWRLFVYVEGTGNLYRTADDSKVVTGSFDVTATIHKGTIPIEPPHRTFWDGNTSMRLVNDDGEMAHDTTFTGAKEMPSEYYSWRLPEDRIVPPRTDRLTVTLTWDPERYPHREWSIALHPANVHPTVYDTSDLLFPEGSSCGDGCREFEVGVLPEQTDAYYQSKSNWIFMLDDGDDPDTPFGSQVYGYGPNEGTDSTHAITVFAHREATEG